MLMEYASDSPLASRCPTLRLGRGLAAAWNLRRARMLELSTCARASFIAGARKPAPRRASGPGRPFSFT